MAELAMHTLVAAASVPVAGSCKFALDDELACKRDSFVGFGWTKVSRYRQKNGD